MSDLVTSFNYTLGMIEKLTNLKSPLCYIVNLVSNSQTFFSKVSTVMIDKENSTVMIAPVLQLYHAHANVHLLQKLANS